MFILFSELSLPERTFTTFWLAGAATERGELLALRDEPSCERRVFRYLPCESGQIDAQDYTELMSQTR